MIRIAIVEDSESASDKLLEYIRAYEKSSGEMFDTVVFCDGISFLTNYRSDYDLVFMDIELPHLNGMDVAEKLRLLDKKILLIFVTNMAQFAVRGYEVDALDYLVKPVGYNNFQLKMKKAVDLIKADSDVIVVTKPGGMFRILVRDIEYIEATGHKIVYHFDRESISGTTESLSKLEERLQRSGFLRCNKCYLVNCRHIRSVEGNAITMFGGDRLQISRPRKKTFMTELAEWMGKGN